MNAELEVKEEPEAKTKERENEEAMRDEAEGTHELKQVEDAMEKLAVDEDDQAMDVLQTPQVYKMRPDIVLAETQELKVGLGDELMVCGVGKTSVWAYNPRNRSAGRIASKVLETQPLRAGAMSTDIRLSSDCRPLLSADLWQSGAHLRVYQWPTGTEPGIACNLNSLQFGLLSEAVSH